MQLKTLRATDLQAAPVPARQQLCSRAKFSIKLSVGGVAMAIRSDDPRLCASLGRRYREHRCFAPPDVDYYVVRDDGGYRFFGPNPVAHHWPHGDLPVDALTFLTDAVALSSLIRSDERLISYHAAAVEAGGRAAAIVAESCGGKTTTALACARIGMRVYSDERLILRDGLVQPFLRTCNVREGGKRRLLDDSRDDALAAALERSDVSDLSFVEVFGKDVAARPSPLGAVFLVEKGGEETAAAIPITAHQALPALSRWADALGERLATIAKTNALLRAVACYRLRLGTPHATARCIDETLRGR